MVNAQELALLISLGMLFTFLMGIGIVLLAKKNRKIQELSDDLLKEEKDKKDLEKLEVAIATQEAERSQIARLLHDDVGAILSLAQKNMLNIQQKAQEGEIEHKSIALTMEYIQESINQLRKINKGLVPHYLLKFGLAKALERMGIQKTEALIDAFQFSAALPDNLVLEEIVMTHYFYVASELITNLLKHSYPTSIEMHLSCEMGRLKLMIQHNGIALSQLDFQRLAADSDSLGLENMRYRMGVINGEILFKRFETHGVIELVTPLKQKRNDNN